VTEGRGSDTDCKFELRAGKLWKLPLCGSNGKIKLQRHFPTAPTSLGKLSPRYKSAESFPQFPQLRRLGFVLGRETGERSRYLLPEIAGTWLGTLNVNREKGWLPRKC
jgi:hypothetical protein